MTKIRKGLSYAIGVLGAVCLVLGIGVIVCSGLLANTVSKVTVKEEHSITAIFNTSNISLFDPYWLLTFFYLIPSILALFVGCTRRIFLVFIYAVFNIISLIASSIGTILLSLLLAVWTAAEINLETNCKTIYDSTNKIQTCLCNETRVHPVTFERAACKDLYSFEGLLMAVLSLIILQGFVSFIASYVSCYAICNKEEGDGPSESSTLTSTAFGGPYGRVFSKHGQYEAL